MKRKEGTFRYLLGFYRDRIWLRISIIDIEYSDLGISRDSLFAEGFNEYLNLVGSLNNIDRGSESSARYSRG